MSKYVLYVNIGLNSIPLGPVARWPIRDIPPKPQRRHSEMFNPQ